MNIEIPLDDELKLRILRFFCYDLTPSDFAFNTDKDKAIIEQEYAEKEARINAQAQRKVILAEDEYKFKMRDRKIILLITLAVLLLGVIAVATNTFAGLGIIIILAIVIYDIYILTYMTKIYNKKEKELRDTAEWKRQSLEQYRIETDAVKREIDNMCQKLYNAWLESKATKEEILQYINGTFAKIEPQISELLDLSEDSITDLNCAEIWAPAFFQTERLPHPVRADINRSKYDIYSLRDKIISPLRGYFSDDMTWHTFYDQFMAKLNLHNEDALRLSAYNAMRYDPVSRKYLTGYYFYQKIFCTEDYVTQL